MGQCECHGLFKSPRANKLKCPQTCILLLLPPLHILWCRVCNQQLWSLGVTSITISVYSLAFIATLWGVLQCKVTQVNKLRLTQNGRHLTDDIFKSIFLNENVWILIKISLKFVPKGPFNNITSLVQIMAWRRPSHFLNQWWLDYQHICVTRPQWVNNEPYEYMKGRHEYFP